MRKTVDRTVSRFYTVERQFSCEAIQLKDSREAEFVLTVELNSSLWTS